MVICPPPPPRPALIWGRGGCKKNEISDPWGFLHRSGSKFETVKDDLKYSLSQKLVTHLLGYSAPATYYLCLALVFTD